MSPFRSVWKVTNSTTSARVAPTSASSIRRFSKPSRACAAMPSGGSPSGVTPTVPDTQIMSATRTALEKCPIAASLPSAGGLDRR
jgi:hypothetical protein